MMQSNLWIAATRRSAGLIVGYVIYAQAAMVLADAADEGRPGRVAMTILALVGAGLMAGFLARGISGSMGITMAVATLIAVAALANLVLRLGAEPVWFKLTCLVGTSSAAWFGGRCMSGWPLSK